MGRRDRQLGAAQGLYRIFPLTSSLTSCLLRCLEEIVKGLGATPALGLRVKPLSRALAIEEIAGQDPAAGWTLANPLDQAYLGARLPAAGAEDIYGRRANVLIAEQLGRPLQAGAASGGYRMSGRVPFVSNCYDADWIAMEAAVMAGDQARAVGSPVAIPHSNSTRGAGCGRLFAKMVPLSNLW